MFGFRSRHFDSGGGGGGADSAVIDVEQMDLRTGDGMRKAIAQIAEAVNRGNGDAEAMANVQTQMREFAAQMEEVNAIARGNRPDFSRDQVLGKLALHLDPDSDMPKMSRTQFNLTALSPEELIGAAGLGERLAGLDPRVGRVFGDGVRSEVLEDLREFQRANDELLFISEMMWSGGRGPGSRMADSKWQLMKQLRAWKTYERLGTQFAKALNETTNNQGLFWVPTILSSNMVDLVQVQLKVAALFPRLTMTSKILDNPVLGGDATAYLQAEATGDGTGTAITASQPTIAKTTFTAQKLAVRIFASSESLEDSIVPLLPFIQGQTAKVTARGIEDAIVNGDTNASMDGATYNPVGGVKRAWNGLRQQALDSTSNPAVVNAGNVGATKAMALSLLRLQNNYGAIVQEGAWVVGFLGWANILNQAEVVTLEKYGPGASVLTGEVARWFGRPVILSEYVTDNYNASGVFDGITTTRADIIHVYRSAYALAQRRDLRVQASTERHIELDQTVVVSTWRGDFEPFFPASATSAPVGVIYNVAGP